MTSTNGERHLAELALDRPTPTGSPPPHPGLISRPQLVSRLREAKGHSLVLLTAPAGYAKTSVLAQWAEVDERPFAWVTLDSRDDAPSRLLNRLVEAIDSVSSRGRPFVVVIDEADALRGKGALTALENTIASLPPEGQMALAWRREPALPLGRMRANRQVFELGRRDLAMNRAESTALLEAVGVRLRPEDVDRIYALTEGWPAALYLTGLALGEEAEVPVDPAGFGGDDRFVSDYLRDEFLGRPSIARLRFLIRSSILEDLDGQICDEVLERSGSGRVLKELARSNLPVEALNHSDSTYRYQPLFKQMLHAELHRREPELEERLERRASDWYAEHEQFDEAIDHAIAAGDDQRAGELIWALAGPLVAAGDRGAVREWLDRFSDDKIAGSPQLALCAAHLYMALGEGELGLHWASVAHEGFDDEALEDPDLQADLLMLRATLPQEGIAQMGRDATRAAELHAPENPWRGISCFYAGAACHLGGDLPKARELLEEGARRGAANAPLVQVLCLTQLTMLHLDRDDLEAALRVSAQAREQLQRFELGTYPVMAFTLAASSLMRSRQGRIEEAVADRKQSLELLEHLAGFPDWYVAETRIFLARASLYLDDKAAASALLDDAAIVADRIDDAPALQRWLSETQAWESSAPGGNGRVMLTPAELRTLQFLPSHLSFREIAEESFVSANTVKTQAQAIYRKLDASSRAQAVDHAREHGLLSDTSHV